MGVIRAVKQKRLKRILFGLILVSVGIILAVFVGQRRQPDPNANSAPPAGKEASMSIAQVQQTATRDGFTEWRLQASSATYLAEEKKAHFRKVSVTFFLKDGNEVLLTADEGMLKTDSNDIEVSGNVVVKSREYRMETQALGYQHEKRLLFSKAPVKISGEYFDLLADGMSVDINRRQARFNGNVRGNLDERAAL